MLRLVGRPVLLWSSVAARLPVVPLPARSRGSATRSSPPAPGMRWRRTATAAASSCSVASAPTAATGSATPGNGTATSGRRARARGRWPATSTRWRTTRRADAWCCTAGWAARATRRSPTPGNGTAARGRRPRRPTRRRSAGGTPWPGTASASGWSCSAATARSATPGNGTAPTWTQLAAGEPHRRRAADHAMAYDAARGRVVLFGGTSDGAAGLDDTWEWDGSTWTPARIRPTRRRRAARHAMAYDRGAPARRAVRRRRWLTPSLRRHLGMGRQRLDAARPGGQPVAARRATRWPTTRARQRVVLFGGDWTAPLADTWEWDGNAWTQRAARRPAAGARSGHAVAYDTACARRGAVRRRSRHAIASLRDTWEWDGSDWTQRRPAASPPAAMRATRWPTTRGAARMRAVRRLGRRRARWPTPGNGTAAAGRSASPATSAAAALRPRAWPTTRRAARGAVRRLRPAAHRRHLGMGRHAAGRSARRAQPTGARRHTPWPTTPRASASCCSAAPASTASLADTWEWDGNDWTQRSADHRRPRRAHSHAMAYDLARGRVVLFGGGTQFGASHGDTWEWDGNDWLLRSTSGPSARCWHSMAYDIARQRVVLFGWRCQRNSRRRYLGMGWHRLEAAARAPSGRARRGEHGL